MTPAVSPTAARSQFDRDGLVHRHLPLVCAVASHVHHQIGRQIPVDDLIGFGLEGAYEAAVRYDPARGQLFSTYAYRRIRGAIYDRLHEWSQTPRSRYAEPRTEPPLQPSVEEEACRRELGDRLLSALERLSAREQHIIRRCYCDEIPVSEVARELGISQSRASHIHTKAIGQLRAELADCATW